MMRSMVRTSLIAVAASFLATVGAAAQLTILRTRPVGCSTGRQITRRC